jgi:hypothetical protein
MILTFKISYHGYNHDYIISTFTSTWPLHHIIKRGAINLFNIHLQIKIDEIE